VVVAPADSGLFTAQAQAAAELSQQATDMLLDKAAHGGDAEAAACAAGAEMNPSRLSPRGTSLAGSMTSAAAAAFCNAGGWVDAGGGAVSQDGAAGYSADTAGFTAGIDRMFGLTRVGFAVGYDATNLDDDAGGQASSGITRLSLYASQPVGRLMLAGVLSEGLMSASTQRATGVGQIGESHGASIVSGGAAVMTTVNLGDYAVLPSAGLRFADVSGDGFAEGRPRGIAGAFALDGKIPGYASVQPYVAVGVGRRFVTAGGVVVSPHVSVGYEVQAGAESRAAQLVAADGTVFASDAPREDGGDALLGAGISAGKGNWALYANYAAHVAGNWSAQVGEAGLRISF
jgi:outer membrane autotransporter protein